ncbi:MAG: SHOCT domain-containing protein [Xenococcus sp. MO_188.B8]|nr:SHOCT domain-containing protein [Xenococcus sp. MO_188.B8]
MAVNYFISQEKDLSNLYKKLILWFKEKQYLVDSVEKDNEYLIQAKKTGTLRTLTGTNQAFKVKIIWSTDTDNEFIVETSTGKWITNIAGAGFTAMFTGGFTVLTGLAGAGWALVVEANLINYIENTLNYKKIKNEVNSQQQFIISKDDLLSNITLQDNVDEEQKLELYKINSPRSKAEEKVKEELLKLEIAYQEQVLTKDEFEFKKRELELIIERYEIDFAVEAKMAKLEQAFIQGILSEDEYEAKVTEVRNLVEEQIRNQRFEAQKSSYIIKLKQAVEDGILSKSEYEAKIASFKPENMS